MAKSVNKVFLLGNVGKDPEIRSTPGGAIVANFTLATSDRFQDAQGLSLIHISGRSCAFATSRAHCNADC